MEAVVELHPAVVVESIGDRVRVFGGHVGRGLELPTEAWSQRATRPGILRRLQSMGLHAAVDLQTLVPCPHRATLWLVDEGLLWCPVPEAHGAGGHGYRSLALTVPQAHLWAEFNGRRTVAGAAKQAGIEVIDALKMIRPWTSFASQVLQLRPTPPHPRDPSLSRLMGALRSAHARETDQFDDSGATSLAAYHLDNIDNGTTHFDNRETTVAHALALPHPGLGMRPYGEALRAALNQQGPVVEVGCGTGELAAAWLAVGPVTYVRVDLSPELLRTQARHAPDSVGILADGIRLPLRDRSVPFLLSNEVLADLRSVPCAAMDAHARQTAANYELQPEGWANVGAWSFVEEVARVLADDGVAVLTEFGTLDGPAEEAVQLDHPEVSIQFPELARVADALGLDADIVRLDELLGLELRAPQLSRTSWMALRALADARGVHLPARAWTPENLAIPWHVAGIHWTDLADEGPGPLVTRFYALCLRRRARSAIKPSKPPSMP